MGILVNGDCLNYMKTLSDNSVECVFLDPPDNVGLAYASYKDWKPFYLEWLEDVVGEACRVGMTTWVSYYYQYDLDVSNMVVNKFILTHDWRKIIWRYTFGQYNSKDFASGYRILLRLCKRDVAIMRPEAILEESERQRIGDKRAVTTGRVPDDVWDFPRVTGNSVERCPWHPTQHPVVIYDRIMKYSCNNPTAQGNIGFLDLFAGTGTCFRAELLNPGVKTIGVEIDSSYCERILQSHRHVCT